MANIVIYGLGSNSTNLIPVYGFGGGDIITPLIDIELDVSITRSHNFNINITRQYSFEVSLS